MECKRLPTDNVLLTHPLGIEEQSGPERDSVTAGSMFTLASCMSIHDTHYMRVDTYITDHPYSIRYHQARHYCRDSRRRSCACSCCAEFALKITALLQDDWLAGALHQAISRATRAPVDFRPASSLVSRGSVRVNGHDVLDHGHRGRGHMTASIAVNETRLRFASSDEAGTALKLTNSSPMLSSSCSHAPAIPRPSLS